MRKWFCAIILAGAVVAFPFEKAYASIEDVFGEAEEKGNVIVTFLTSGWFGFALVAGALAYVALGIMGGRMELSRAAWIVFGSFLLGRVPAIASWLLGA